MQKDNFSWQRFVARATSFGLTLGLEIYLVGILLGGYLDRLFFGDKGFAQMALVLLVIVFSLVLLCRDFMRDGNPK